MASALKRRRKKSSFPLALLILTAVAGLFSLLLFSDQFRSYLRTQIGGGGDEPIGPPVTASSDWTVVPHAQTCWQAHEDSPGDEGHFDVPSPAKEHNFEETVSLNDDCVARKISRRLAHVRSVTVETPWPTSSYYRRCSGARCRDL